MRIIRAEELKALEGQDVATSDWFVVDQERIHRFAAATGDDQWIHSDIERAKAESPYGTTIAHGFLTLSLLSTLAARTFKLEGDFKMGINYGLNRVRFPCAVPSGGEVRAHFRLNAVEEISGGVQTVWGVTVELKGAAKPCLVAEWVTRAYR